MSNLLQCYDIDIALRRSVGVARTPLTQFCQIASPLFFCLTLFLPRSLFTLMCVCFLNILAKIIKKRLDLNSVDGEREAINRSQSGLATMDDDTLVVHLKGHRPLMIIPAGRQCYRRLPINRRVHLFIEFTPPSFPLLILVNSLSLSFSLPSPPPSRFQCSDSHTCEAME